MKFNFIPAVLLMALGCAACGRQAPAGTEPARIVADFSSGRVTLMGSLPNERAHDRLLERARQLYGPAQIQDRIRVDANVIDAPWLSADSLLLPLVDNAISEGQSAFDGKRLILTGEVPSETIRAQISERAAKAAGNGVSIENHLQVSR